MEVGMVIKPSVWLYARNKKERTDELFMGWAVGVIGEREGYYEIMTHYGYRGLLKKTALRFCTYKELQARDASGQEALIKRGVTDVMEQPCVQSKRLSALRKGSFVTLLPEETGGYHKVRLADGQTGYIPSVSYKYRMDSDGYLYDKEPETYFLRQKKKRIQSEETFRELLAANAKNYLGVQYRWAGKSAQGIDCSGFTFMCYFLNGILIYRDAELNSLYPIHEIPKEQIRIGDLLYFPGHVALYIGNQRYIHATGNEKSFGCVINSLSKDDFDYRKDLAESFLMAGSLFAE